jgi:hypothetical protein
MRQERRSVGAGRQGAFARFLLAACVAGLALSGAVAAAGAPDRGAGGVRVKFKESIVFLDGSHGYDVIVHTDAPGHIGVDAQKGPAFAEYTAPGTATARKVKGDFGELGKVKGRFHAKKTTHPDPDRGCSGTVTEKIGIWRGRFKFKGEHRYTKVSETEADGYTISVNEVCHARPSHKHQYLQLVAQTSAPVKRTVDHASFDALLREGKAGAKPEFETDVNETKGNISILRGADVLGKRSQFTSQDDTHAVVKPPAPFIGTGTYDNGAWTGNLKAKLPGATVALTGPDFTATLEEVKFKGAH